MTRYAHVTDTRVDGIYDSLPVSWKNVSNFHLLSDEKLEEHGFFRVSKSPMPTYDPTTTIVSAPVYTFTGSGVLEHVTLSPKENTSRDIESEWREVRRIRDEKIAAEDWRYARALREERQGQKITDDIVKLDRYIQDLANIPQTFSDPKDVVWPVYGE